MAFFFCVGCGSTTFLPLREGGADASDAASEAASEAGQQDSGQRVDGGTFSCEGKTCAVGIEYCHVVAGTASCLVLPQGCTACACLPKGGACTCNQDGSGNITETCQ